MMRRMVVLLGLALTLALPACGGAQQPPGVASAEDGARMAASPAPSLSDAQRALNYVHCMREHGIQMKDPVDGVKGLDPVGGPAKGAPGGDAYAKKVSSARAACAALAPPGAVEGAPLTGQALADARAFAQCMRQHGVDWPDPVGGQPGAPTGDFRSDPKVSSAMQVCERQDGPRNASPRSASPGGEGP